ncbi:aromatic amino acid hydroxylase [Hufsiella ginkgonis]|uniref:Aromatic amino acid hydroxylase n=1 Tax=Hufsiella ginkgonis TaxID=2695274 RepID=A0A7K1XZL1_9SPHI|nr:aromatic amino acid hydroxylase [Hufsiella ginkgonis]MXV16159.1 aromatic amino acid hydroxylase [Hufsiella ginkgonis]
MDQFNDFHNAQVALLPRHLRQYIVDQHYEHYTAADHAVWRYVMRQNYSYLKDVAYYPYIPGLEKAGLTIERIPDLQEMNDALGKIGWGAVTVDGFIPPAAFMEYQAYRVLVIAADIRQMEHIEYTPAPDIIHESAGHAPIIAEPDYNKYLSYFGSIGSKAMFSSADFELYETIRELSILKEMHDADPESIRRAEERVAACQDATSEPSEMALLSRLHWWTVEYGLIGTPEDPKIYGAGLLSSIGESASCMDPGVKKLWYTPEAVNYTYDITKPQPQLFVTPDFENLITVLERFAEGMAFRKGGSESVLKAIESRRTATVVYSSGLQVSGVVTDLKTDEYGEPAFIRTTGPTALSYDGRELAGHGKGMHINGFSSVVGKLKGSGKLLEDFGDDDLKYALLSPGEDVTLEFENGFTLAAEFSGSTRIDGKLVLLSFRDCLVTDKEGTVYFDPSWGTFDLAIGERIVSVFSGAADKDAFEDIVPLSKTSTHHPVHDEHTRAYHALFARVRNCREEQRRYDELPAVYQELSLHFPADWLCRLEILELLEKESLMPDLADHIRNDLAEKRVKMPGYAKLIADGLRMIPARAKL